MFHLPSLPILVILFGLCQGIIVTIPNTGTVWSSSVPENVIAWSLLVPTNPQPLSKFFDIYLRQGTGLYNPVLNISIAQNVDSILYSSISFPLNGELKAGQGYQLFFSAPGNANLVYCDSAIFTISRTIPSQSTTAQSAPVIASQASVTTTAVVSKQTPTTMTTKVSTSSTAAQPSLKAANAPGGLQGNTNFSNFSSATIKSSAGLTVMILGILLLI